jgi:hypothetical protein
LFPLLSCVVTVNSVPIGPVVTGDADVAGADGAGALVAAAAAGALVAAGVVAAAEWTVVVPQAARPAVVGTAASARILVIFMVNPSSDIDI